MNDPDELEAADRCARDYAIAHVGIGQITDEFESVIAATDPARPD